MLATSRQYLLKIPPYGILMYQFEQYLVVIVCVCGRRANICLRVNWNRHNVRQLYCVHKCLHISWNPDLQIYFLSKVWSPSLSPLFVLAKIESHLFGDPSNVNRLLIICSGDPLYPQIQWYCYTAYLLG